jgi:hypothetical protein
MTSREWRSTVGRLTGQVLTFSLLLSSPTFANWQMREFLILYSYGWPAEQVVGRLTELTAREIAAAHYNTVMCATPELELVAKAGLRCLVIGRSQGAPDWVGEAVSPAVARTLSANPGVWGYYVMDEPDNKNWKRGAVFQQLAERVREYRTSDPNHPTWINMTAATGGFLADYMEVVKPDFLSFDMYRWWSRENYWWRGLETHRDAASRARVPMIVWIESNTNEKLFNAHLPPPEDNATKIRWSVYTSLAYGSKGVQWFLGTTNEDVARLNGELSVLGPTLIRLESTHVFHTSGVPAEGLRLPESSWYFTDAQDLVIGEFVNPGEPNASYLLIANKSIEKDVDAVFEFRRRAVPVVEEVNKMSVGRTALPMDRQAGATRVRVHLSAGDGRLIRVETP